MVNGKTISIEKPNPNHQQSLTSDGPRLAKENEFGITLPGEVVSIDKEPGDVIKEGQSIATIESMKMQMQITAPNHLVGQKIERVFPSVRTSSNRGDILPKNGALFSYRQVRSFSTFLKGPVRSRVVAGAIILGARFFK